VSSSYLDRIVVSDAVSSGVQPVETVVPVLRPSLAKLLFDCIPEVEAKAVEIIPEHARAGVRLVQSAISLKSKTKSATKISARDVHGSCYYSHTFIMKVPAEALDL